jgi:hypothetical protein
MGQLGLRLRILAGDLPFPRQMDLDVEFRDVILEIAWNP